MLPCRERTVEARVVPRANCVSFLACHDLLSVDIGGHIEPIRAASTHEVEVWWRRFDLKNELRMAEAIVGYFDGE